MKKVYKYYIHKSLFILFLLLLILGYSRNAIADSKRIYEHNHKNFICFKHSYYISNNTCKKILENIKKAKKKNSINCFMKGTNLNIGTVRLIFRDKKKAKKIIEEAASKNKGVVISCIEHSNFKYKYSYKNRILISVNE